LYFLKNKHFQSICTPVLLLLGLWILGPGCGQKKLSTNSSTHVRLSPRDWGDDVLDEYTELHRKAGHERPLAQGRNGMIAVTTGTLAARAGLEALRQGGHVIIGLWTGIQIDPSTRLLRGAVSRDFTGHAEGY